MKLTHDATSGAGGAATDDPVAALLRLGAELSGVADELVPERVPGHRMREITAALTAIERRARGARLVLRKAAADTGDWKAKGHKSPADQVAAEEGISVGQARTEIEASERLADLPQAREAAGRGEISPESAAVVAAGAAADPDAESGLVRSARRGDLRATRRRAQEAITRADERSGRLAERIHQRRSLRAWVSLDGEGHGVWNIPPESQARVVAALEPYRKAAFAAARAAGERLTEEQLMADALDMLARDVLLDHEATSRASTETTAPPASTDGAQPATRLPRTPDRPPRPRPPTPGETPDEPEPSLFAADEPAGPAPPAPCPQTPPPPVPPPPPKRHRRPPAQVHVLVDFDALRRGHTVDGETCEIHGLGAIPVSLARQLMTDALLRLVVTGTDVTKVTSQRRYVPEAVRRALFARDKGRCVVCGSDRYLELHHFRVDHAKGGPTEYDNLAHVCTRHHALATHCGWTLHHTDHGWTMRPPDGGDATDRSPP